MSIFGAFINYFRGGKNKKPHLKYDFYFKVWVVYWPNGQVTWSKTIRESGL